MANGRAANGGVQRTTRSNDEKKHTTRRSSRKRNKESGRTHTQEQQLVAEMLANVLRNAVYKLAQRRKHQ